MLVYLNDILMCKRPQEHAQHLRILDVLRQHKWYAKMPKCELNKPELHFLGHSVGKQGIRMDPVKTAVPSAASSLAFQDRCFELGGVKGGLRTQLPLPF